MTPQLVFYIIIAFVTISFVVDQFLDWLNAKHFDDPIPQELSDVYDKESYRKSQDYKKANARFSALTSSFMLVVTLLFFFADGFGFVDQLARSVSDNEIVVGLIFFGIIMLGTDILTTPFSYYKTFVIEERFGFNKSTPALFFMDKLKGLLMTIIVGGGLLALVIWFYQISGSLFWLYAWILFAVFAIVTNMFYARLIVPLFNKQTPLRDGGLRNKIESYATSVGFKLKNIFVIDGSKRSTKANAYFSGFGSEKRITLYDTLINDLEEEEIVAVLAHEVGHYRKNHIIINLFMSLLLTGFTLWLLGLFVSQEVFSLAIGVEKPSFHAGLVAFGILYAPISGITGFLMSVLSRKFEYQADNFAKETYAAQPLITSLKKLSRNSLSNLTPHPLYVKLHYSHPTLLQRYRNLKS
ncbi:MULTISPECIES: M48 family metallopeptidase [unclassified Leeuwenhoekiella]|uniref:M48 family metallopeptidase n=1 Tax=unclassified Leeuwenhoekiella TaxID=2615029 RepID=UPI000C3A159F|nr:MULTISPECIES: M48 family metallopeptidase [unclassified Leeuwenhoekiella]MAW95110.1 peptidase M48 [Leeuwenhoekiella sp.]MBA79830.1 peptidase M48 [Leeuwenhoekiella sp.]|tara:strand:+ start:18808 stop:20040 length:1233 start_codon:yes stop_codon:yes gene_type:complete